MEKKTGIPTVSLIVIALLVLSFCGHVSSSSMNQPRRPYIVYTRPSSVEERTQMFTSISLASESTSSSTPPNLLYAYNHINAVSAMLTPDEAMLMEAHGDVVQVRHSVMYELHTTRTPLFLNLDKFPEQYNKAASNVVIGVVDTGVLPESPSFDDKGLGPVPTNWKGGCDEGVKCNKKLVGARSFTKGYEAFLAANHLNMTETRNPRDVDGHGTHTSSTAAGSPVDKANLFGFADGTARGMAQTARIAVYKVCWSQGCADSDMLAAMDRAIDDNVDVLSLSLGSKGEADDYYLDTLAIGAFAAMQKGIVVSCSAGNSGPAPSSVINVAPWILTVGASTLDRDFPATLKLGNDETFHGVSLSSSKSTNQRLLPIVYAQDVSTNGSSLCLAGTLVPAKVKGKIVMCDRGVNPRVEKGLVVDEAGGLGMVLANAAEEGDGLVADAHVLPATAVTAKMAAKIKKYIDSFGSLATATIMSEGTRLGVQPSPVLASFSSRGPNPLNPEILKPDLIAPGVNILAAWTKAVGPTGLPFDERLVDFNIISGTSMSCPHVSGLAALLKAAHPDWSPAAIRSALMTTAYSSYKNGTTILDEATGGPSDPFGFGAGHVTPLSALDPGLVYDIIPLDYFDFLCAIKYNSTLIKSFAALGNTSFTCDMNKTYSVNDLNYPSFAVSFKADQQGGSVSYRRTLTNVGAAGKYKVSVLSPSSSVKITVQPETLTFVKPNQKESYTVTFTVASKMKANTNQFGSIEWFDGKHTVRSPVAFSWT